MGRVGSSWDDQRFPTVPLPAVAGYEDPASPLRSRGGGRAGGGAGPRSRSPAWSRRRFRRARRVVQVLMALAALGALALGGLLLVTPSVADAPARAQAIDRSHHAVYPGPPVPARFASSLIATEDHRFYSEPGIDPFAVARLIWGRITNGPDPGGATIYQQLAKMLYAQGRAGVMVNAEEVALGIKLDFSFPKPAILRMYSDVVYFGHGYYGLAAASCGYFGVAPARLSWPQAAMLAGLVQAPSADDPIMHYQSARARQAHVLGRLVAVGALTQAQAQQAYRQRLGLVGGSPTGCAA